MFKLSFDELTQIVKYNNSCMLKLQHFRMELYLFKNLWLFYFYLNSSIYIDKTVFYFVYATEKKC